MKKTTTDRDTAKTELLEMTTSQRLLQKEKVDYAASIKLQVNLLEKNLKDKQADFDKLTEDADRQTKQYNQIKMERDKMK